MGELTGIFIAGVRKAPLLAMDAARVQTQGIAGDRYSAGQGSFSRWPGSGRAISLIEQEVIDAVNAETGHDLSDGRSRRNLVTVGVRLADLNGRAFRIGAVVLRGVRLCAPCRYLERFVGAGAYESLRGRGGLRGDVVEEGEVRVGDEIQLM